ncbi:MAG: anthranilate synthase component I family protein [Nocardioidaceae bacterium]
MNRSFWLDGGGARDWSGRRTLTGTLDDSDVSLTYEAGRVLRHQHGIVTPVGDDIFDALAEAMAPDDGDPSVHWVGYFGYACNRSLPARPSADPRVPDAVWMRKRLPTITDTDPIPPPDQAPRPAPAGVPPAYADAFARVQEALLGGYSYEVNLTYREAIESPRSPAEAYARLRTQNPAPYAGFLAHGDMALLSSSPERYATITRDRLLETKPIKGTTPSSEDPARLAADPRYRAENLMIVDLLRNDLARVCEPGTVTVPVLMNVESYPSVHQLVSTVRGRLRPEVSTIDALRALFPAGSMTGAPKRETMRIIDEVEPTPRGVYAGAFGWISADGRADLGVVIRSLVATPCSEGWRYEYGTGGGITVHSDVDSEYAETRWKAERLRTAVE